MTRKIHLGLFLLGTGSHVAGWRVPDAMDSFQDIGMVKKIAMEAERGLFDLIFMGDNLHTDPAAHPSYTARLEPLTLLSAVAGATRYIGLGATVSTTYSDPFTVARLFASLDHLSGGRAAWNAVTTANPTAAANFGTLHPDHSKRYEIAEEFLTVVRGLWDCWADDAIVADRETGLYIDPARVRPLDHEGTHFKVKGPLNIGRSPQGQPVILQAGGSGPGQELAAKSADVVFSVTQDLDDARVFYRSVKDRLAGYGRSEDSMVILPGVMPIVGRTEREAHDKLARLQGFVSETNALSLLSDRFGIDMSVHDLDGPIPPDLVPSDSYHAFARVMLEKAKRDNMRLRDVYNLMAAARGHWVLCGTPDYVADTLETWFTTGAADGFNVMPSHFPDGLTDFVDMVVPILQERGLYRTEYEGTTLRDRMGFARPERG
ncbi:LLM class flavin-dependent oxidoreductase [Rhizobium sp. TRM96647]|uniref:LLM class flavin-dependent oxidoreductase n=1 Tax=unclassified Rhizobium TaxID=2613769 RepID=UPI0021E8ABE4|nr:MULTISPECIES: LLM class flavin-dependent oxidoreductase [unclassified Rhizobium]MCV3736145.1 LLM class flavin-dependent oxidoreductase [Rhizobium sp. TRM96647]MCV3758193.1 LLM class flavin-dependent oxidoreductase [Rhizobium sp. TRM96650]